MIVRRAVEGLDDRLDGSSFVARNLKKVFPDHWSFMLGELAIYSFVLLILTGTFLAFFYVASPEQTVYQGPYEPLQGRSVSLAYDSVLRLSFEVRAGLVMRQTHHWSALVFMAAIVAHMIRVFFTGAFRKPRELSWLIGVGLVVTGIMAGFTGYSLPDDLLSGVGLRIAYAIAQSIPFVGNWLANMFFGGEFPGNALLPRLLTLHIFVIPLVILGMMSVHLGVVWHQTHTQFRAPGRTNETVTGTPVWPKFAVKSIGLAFVTFAVLTLLGGLFQINPVWFYGPYVPYSGPSPSQPDWYAGWLEGLLRLWPNWELTMFGVTIGELFLPAIVVPGIMFTLLATWPFLEARFSGDHEWHNFAQRPREAPLRSALGGAAVALMVVLFLAGSNDVLAKYLQIEVDTFNTVLKVLLFVLPVIVGLGTFAICRDLRARPRRPMRSPATMTVRRTEDGGFEEIHEAEMHEAGSHDEVGRAMTAPRLRRAVAPAAIVFFLAACSGSFGMPRGASEQAHETFTLWQIFFITAIPVAGIVYALMLWSLIRYRRRRSHDPDALGSQRRENLPLEIVYTAVPVLIVVALFVLSIRTDDRVTDIAPDPALVVRVEAFAWGWRFAYPNGVAVVSPPSGEDAADPVMMLPVGRTVRVELTSNDTIHAFWVPDFLYKHDAIPGRTFEFDVTPTELGTFHGHCAEFCGLNHAYMNFSVQVVEGDDFDTWLRREAA